MKEEVEKKKDTLVYFSREVEVPHVAYCVDYS